MCCRKRSIPANFEETLKNNAEVKPENFQELIDSLQVNPVGIEELKRMKEQIMVMPEWKKINRTNLSKLKQESGMLMKIMISQIRDLSKGLKAMIIINTKLEENVVRENKISK